MKTMDVEKVVVVEQPTTRRRRRTAETPEASLPVGEIPEAKTDVNDIAADMGGALPFDASVFDAEPVAEQITPNKRRRRRNIEM